MCGEHAGDTVVIQIGRGSSPRVRGARPQQHVVNRAVGIIPACAGSTSYGASCIGTPGDHPRVCGEHSLPRSPPSQSSGSSPRVRGARLWRMASQSSNGIIPACAGSTTPYVQPRTQNRDHPRVCGEHTSFTVPSSPMMGSSPRVRGALHRVTTSFPSDGIIPACAGSTSTVSQPAPGRWDHPRVCGEHHCRAPMRMVGAGSSPRVRGAPKNAVIREPDDGIIPACAGSTGTASNARARGRDHPRVCGEHRYLPGTSACCAGSSPRVRGAPNVAYVSSTVGGIIPACAGSTQLDRVPGNLIVGSSPRVRGALCR